MTDTTSQLLASTVELWLERRRSQAGFHDAALPDVLRQMLTRGVLARADDGQLISRAGGSPDDVLEIVRRECPHLFRGPDAHATEAKPDLKGMSASARLAVSNGHAPVRP